MEAVLFGLQQLLSEFRGGPGVPKDGPKTPTSVITFLEKLRLPHYRLLRPKGFLLESSRTFIPHTTLVHLHVGTCHFITKALLG